jgi:hypothetical protein
MRKVRGDIPPAERRRQLATVGAPMSEFELTDDDQAVIAMFRTYLTEHPDLASQVVETDIVRYGLRYDFADVSKEMFFIVKSIGILVPVEFDGELYDFLIDLECAPRPAEGGGVFCNFEIEPRKVFATLKDMFRAHAFSSLRDWVLTRLVPANYLFVYGNPAAEESTHAWLAQSLDELHPGGRVFPLRNDNARAKL